MSGVLGAWLILKWGRLFGLLDQSNSRSSHKGIVPKGGGIGILGAVVFASVFLQTPFALWFSAAALSILSLLEDRVETSPKFRLSVQFTAALCFLLPACYLYSDISFLSQFASSPFCFVVCLSFLTVFIVGTANWYNFMDGINGIAAITAIVAFGLMALFNYISVGDSRFTILSICIAFSCLGFLPFNLPKAKVFMGDVGSILLGFIFAAFVVMISKGLFDFLCFAGFLFPFYADELITMSVRIRDGENLLRPHRRHFYQILANELGIDHWKVSAGYGLFQLIVGLSILLVRPHGILPVLILLSAFFIGFILANYVIRTKAAGI